MLVVGALLLALIAIAVIVGSFADAFVNLMKLGYSQCYH